MFNWSWDDGGSCRDQSYPSGLPGLPYRHGFHGPCGLYDPRGPPGPLCLHPCRDPGHYGHGWFAGAPEIMGCM